MEGKSSLEQHHDFYLDEDRKKNTKESFKFIAARASAYLSHIDQPKVLDVGCATGEFLYYLHMLLPDARLTGLDVAGNLLEKARKEVPSADFLVGDIMNKETLPATTYDCVFFIGTHSIFDDYKPWLDNLLRLCGIGGRVYVFGIFNPANADVLIKTRKSGDDGPWQSGWNTWSKATIGSYLETHNVTYTFTDWFIDMDLPNRDDPWRSHTIKLEDGTRLIVNGLQLIIAMPYSRYIPN